MTTSSVGVQSVDVPHERDASRRTLTWATLSVTAQLYVVAVMAAGTAAVIAWFPSRIPEPGLFALLLVTSCLTSLWKVNLPIPLANGSTLSVSYAADLMALLLLGPEQAIVIALAGVWTQCTLNVRRRNPWYRTTFSIAAEALTMAATGFMYQLLGGPLRPVDLATLARPLVGAIATYFFVNTGLIAAAIASTSHRTVREVWVEDFSWSGASFMVAGSAGAAAAVVIARGEHWLGVLMIAPVYLTYKTYQVFIGRLEDRDRHAAEARRLHQETSDALSLGAAGRARAGSREGPSCRHGRRADTPRRCAPGTARTRARGAGQRRRREPTEGSVPGDRLTRAADAAQRHPRLGRHAAIAPNRRCHPRSGLPVDL